MSNPLASGELRRWTFEGVAANSFHKLAAGSLGCEYGFTYTTAAARFCKPDDGKHFEHDGANLVPVNFDHVFEVRLFGALADLHWVREGGMGRLVVTSEEAAAVAKMAAATFEAKMAVCSKPQSARWRDHTYLLWGESVDLGANAIPGWTKLVTARIGTLWVPFPNAAEKARVVLTAREYFVTSTDGNVVFAGERLVGMREAHADDSKFERS